MIEFLFDTTRAIVNMILNGTVARHPNIEMIIPHVGRNPADDCRPRRRVSRWCSPISIRPPRCWADLARLHYDLAGFATPRLDTLLSITTPDHLHYGSDFPFTNEVVVEMLAAPLRELGDPAGSWLAALADNTHRLFPTLARAAAR